MGKKPNVASDENQIERFKETARQLDCDEDEAAFDEKLKALAKPGDPRPAIGKPPKNKA